MTRLARWLGRHWWLLASLTVMLLVANQVIGQSVARLAGR